MSILVTGANGHIGCNVVRELLARGREVVGLVRPNADLEGLADLPIQLRRGDVLDRESVDAAIRGCEAVLHLAAVYDMRARDAEAIMRPAVEGATNVLRAAADAGIRRVVMTSSIVAVGATRRPDAPPRTEADWNDNLRLPYVRAKTESERVAWSLAAELGLELVTLLPAGVLGPFDYRITPSTRYIRDLANRKALTGRGGLAHIDVRDVAFAHVAALESGVPGERYLVSLPGATLARVGEVVGALTGRRPTHIAAPRWMALVTVAVQSTLQRLFRLQVPLTLGEAREGAGRWQRYDSSKAETAFGYTPRPLEETIADTLRWLAARGQLRPDVASRLALPALPA